MVLFKKILTGLILVIGAQAAFGSSDTESQMVCKQFTADKDIKNLISAKLTRVTPCACVEQQIMLEYSFQKIGNCYRGWFFKDGVKQMCCYSSEGTLQIGPPDGGYLTMETLGMNMSNVQRSCCLDKTTCDLFYDINPSDNCSRYQPPSIVSSFGDALIETIDGNKFDFNGHGEYIFLSTSNLEIQVRLEYVNNVSTDATIFTAFAILAFETITITYTPFRPNEEDKTSGDRFEMHLDRQRKDIIVYKYGVTFCNATMSKTLIPCQLPPVPKHCFVLAGGGKIVFIGCSVEEFASSMTFTASDFITLTMKPNKYSKNIAIDGLAGHQTGGHYVCRNKTKIDVNATASAMFDCGETWTLIDESESNFNYSLSAGNYTFYNKHHTRPRFLEDLVGNLTALFEHCHNANITLFKNTCEENWDNYSVNKQCLLAIERTCDRNLGLAEMTVAYNIHHTYQLLHNKPPSFNDTTFPKFLNVTYERNISVILDLKQYVNDDFDKPDEMTYGALTTFPNYTLENGVFKWTVGTNLRYSSTQLTFIVNDTLNTLASQSINIYYCGCEHQIQCDFSAFNGNSSAPYLMKAQCKCGQYSEGLYCEKQLDPCKDFYCSTTCNGNFSHTLSTWPCAECPAGWRSQIIAKHQTCENIDECSLSRKPCDQNCTDTVGSFTCHCDKGYEINPDGHTCDGNVLNNHSQIEEVTHVSCSGSHWNINMDMDTLSLLYPGILPMNIFFGQTNCHGTLEGSVLRFKQSLHSCLTTEKVTGETVIYNNKIFYALLDPINRLIIRKHIWTFAVECDVIRAGSGSSHLHHNIETHTATATKQYNVSVELFSDQNFMQRVTTSNQDFHVGDDVYVKVSTTLTDWSVKMRLHTCYTKPSANATYNSGVILIRDGCEVESNTHIMSQSIHETKFVFQDFEYVTNDQGLYIFCNATFCDSRDYSPACVQSCRQSPTFVG